MTYIVQKGPPMGEVLSLFRTMSGVVLVRERDRRLGQQTVRTVTVDLVNRDPVLFPAAVKDQSVGNIIIVQVP